MLLDDGICLIGEPAILQLDQVQQLLDNLILLSLHSDVALVGSRHALG